MGNGRSRTVQTLRMDSMEQGSSKKKALHDELEWLRQRVLEAETEEERLAHAREIDRVKKDLERINKRSMDSRVDIKIQ